MKLISARLLKFSPESLKAISDRASDFTSDAGVLAALSRVASAPIRSAAQKTYQLFSEHPAHPSLRLERLRSDQRAWAVRVTRDYRAVAFRRGDEWVWFWIGTHKEFDRRFPA